MVRTQYNSANWISIIQRLMEYHRVYLRSFSRWKLKISPCSLGKDSQWLMKINNSIKRNSLKIRLSITNHFSNFLLTNNLHHINSLRLFHHLSIRLYSNLINSNLINNLTNSNLINSSLTNPNKTIS